MGALCCRLPAVLVIRITLVSFAAVVVAPAFVVAVVRVTPMLHAHGLVHDALVYDHGPIVGGGYVADMAFVPLVVAAGVSEVEALGRGLGGQQQSAGTKCHDTHQLEHTFHEGSPLPLWWG